MKRQISGLIITSAVLLAMMGLTMQAQADQASQKVASVETPKLNDREVKRICIFIKNGKIPTVLKFLERIGPYKISDVYLELNCKIGKSERDSSLFHLILQASGLGNLIAGRRILNGLRIEKADPTLAKDILERKIAYRGEFLNAREILYRIWNRAKSNGNLSKNSEKILIQFEKFFDKAGVEITVPGLEKPHY